MKQMINNAEIAAFYDDFITYQEQVGVNDRIYSLYKRVKKFNLKTNSNFLEIGCGIGTLTNLLSRIIKKGKIEALDLSPKSIEYAKKKMHANNVIYNASDILQYQPILPSYDFISLFDVIEHIPIELHSKLFKKLEGFCTNDTKILINIPNPRHLEYYAESDPDGLQIIDQPIHLEELVKNVESGGLQIDYMETYDVWAENDYQFFIISKKRKIEIVKLNAGRTLLQKITTKLKRIYVQLKYNNTKK